MNSGSQFLTISAAPCLVLNLSHVFRVRPLVLDLIFLPLAAPPHYCGALLLQLFEKRFTENNFVWDLSGLRIYSSLILN